MLKTTEKSESRPRLAFGCGSCEPSKTTFDVADGPNYNRENYIPVLVGLQEEISGKFAPKKKKSLILADTYSEMGYDSKASRVADCGTYLEFAVDADSKRLHRANFCKDRLCPTCNWRRSKKIFAQMSKIMDYLEGQNYRFLFLTLTVKNCTADNFPDTVQALFSGWRFLYNKNSVFKKVVCGTFRSLEVTRNQKDGTFHPHLHVILAVRPGYFDSRVYITQSQWTSMWKVACSLDYQPIVHIQTVKNDSRGLAGVVAEVAKYAVKDVDFLSGPMSARMSYVSAFLSSLSGRKLVSMTGCFRQAGKLLSLDDVESGDLVHVDDLSIRSDVAFMIFRYGWRNGFYIQL